MTSAGDEHQQPLPAAARETHGWLTPRTVLRGLVSVALAVLLIVVALPRVTHTEWTGIGQVLEQLTAGDLATLFVVWIAGLLAYTYVLTGLLPGLTHGQALVLNVTGSSVSNLVPFGGAVGVVVTWGMARSWGFSGTAFTVGTLIAGVVNVLAKLALPLFGLLGLLVAGELADGRLVVAAIVAAALLAATLAVLAGVLAHEGVALWTGRAVHRVARRLTKQDHDWEHQLLDLRTRTVGLLRGRRGTILLGLAGFYGSQALLQWLILAELGTTLSIAQVFAGYCFGRLLSSLVITPGGVGIAETGSAGLLVAFGGDPAVSASGVLLFSGFAFLLEIPAGAVGYVVWLTRRRWRAPHERPA